MVSIMLLAVGIDRGMNYLEEKEWESQREAFYQQSRADIHKMQTTIQTLSEDPAALTAYMEENGLNYMEEEEEGTGEGAEEEQAFAEPEREIPQEEAIPQEEEIPQQREEPAVEAMPEDEVVEGMYREPSIPEDGISDNGLSGEYGIREHGIREYGVREHGIREYGIREHGIREHGVRQHGVRQSDSGGLCHNPSPEEQGLCFL